VLNNLQKTLRLAPPIRFGALLLVYLTSLVGALFLAYQLRFEGAVPSDQLQNFLRAGSWMIPLQLFLLWRLGQFRALLRYFSLPDAVQILWACGTVTLLGFLAWYVPGLRETWTPSRGILLANFLLTTFLIAAFRLGLRLAWSQYLLPFGSSAPRKRVLILGAGDVGAELARELELRKGLGFLPVGFLDDNREKLGSQIHGCPVLGAIRDLPDWARETKAEAVVLAMPSAGPAQVRRILGLAEGLGLSCQTVPSMQQLVNGHVHVERIRPVDVEDLLLRSEVPLLQDDVRGMIQGQIVMVTGAGGSIGAELCRQILGLRPAKLFLLERNEYALYSVDQELRGDYAAGTLISLVHDCGDEDKVRGLLQREKPALLFHAAAHKHVPLLEHQPTEAVENNSLKTLKLARWAGEAGVRKFILVSTDKAIRPTSVMGASKRLAELALQSEQRHHPGTQFLSVRFGNVLGSSGSVVPLFKRQIAAGGPVTVTHPEVTRYFMSVSEAAGLILQAAFQGRGGEIFVLDMGDPVKIVDLARELIRLSGLEEGRDIEIRFTGLRPGEKMFEELRYDHESAEKTACQRLWRQRPGPAAPSDFAGRLEALCRQARDQSPEEVRRSIQSLVPEYRPFFDPQS